ncbi:MAG: AtpZ/AtpI family protein [Clostridiales bacterium]|nr:AtpZ/AtpI family protein [Clostridiales bacterium]
MRATKKKKERNALRMRVLITQLGICMLTAIFVCVIIGRFLVQKTGLELLFPIMLLLGIMAGIRSCYITIGRFVNLKSRDPLAYYPEEHADQGLVSEEEMDSEEDFPRKTMSRR